MELRCPRRRRSGDRQTLALLALSKVEGSIPHPYLAPRFTRGFDRFYTTLPGGAGRTPIHRRTNFAFLKQELFSPARSSGRSQPEHGRAGLLVPLLLCDPSSAVPMYSERRGLCPYSSSFPSSLSIRRSCFFSLLASQNTTTINTKSNNCPSVIR